MADYRTDETVVERRGGAGRTLAIVAAIVALVVVILFATGFWSVGVTKEGSLPEVEVNAKGGELPQVDLDSKKVVVGTSETTVEVPKVKTEKETIDVPTIGVTEGDTDKAAKK